jgi:hypothetical protein
MSNRSNRYPFFGCDSELRDAGMTYPLVAIRGFAHSASNSSIFLVFRRRQISCANFYVQSFMNRALYSMCVTLVPTTPVCEILGIRAPSIIGEYLKYNRCSRTTKEIFYRSIPAQTDPMLQISMRQCVTRCAPEVYVMYSVQYSTLSFLLNPTLFCRYQRAGCRAICSGGVCDAFHQGVSRFPLSFPFIPHPENHI